MSAPLASYRDRALLALAAVAALAALKWSAPVTVPAAGALFLMACVWPLYRRLASWLPSGVSAAGALGAVLAAAFGLGAALYGLGASVTSQASLKPAVLAERASRALSDLGVSMSAETILDKAQSTLPSEAGALVGALGTLVITAALLALALPEVRDYRRLAEAARHPALRVVPRIAAEARRYLFVRTVVGLITGVAVSAAAWAIGLEHPLVWGAANFLLNYIPTLGSIVGVVPPVVFAWLSQDVTMALLAFATVGGVQLAMGNIVDPLMQGRFFALPASVVLLSVVLWSFVWGIAGAFLAVPMTSAIVLVCEVSPRTRWVSRLLAPNRDVDRTDRATEPRSGEAHAAA